MVVYRFLSLLFTPRIACEPAIYLRTSAQSLLCSLLVSRNLASTETFVFLMNVDFLLSSHRPPQGYQTPARAHQRVEYYRRRIWSSSLTVSTLRSLCLPSSNNCTRHQRYNCLAISTLLEHAHDSIPVHIPQNTYLRFRRFNLPLFPPVFPFL